ncbi:DUF262 domain-containing protein [Vibrio parahaemolyticus]|nr:DUF262 domain-containing protein [Vibrio parahaemolyticus]
MISTIFYKYLNMNVLDKYAQAQESLVVQTSDFSLKTVSDMVDGSSIDIAPHYQRRERWQNDKQSALIESFLMNVPVPPVYLSEDSFGKYSVIDGKQRITAINKFMRGELKLKEMVTFKELEGKVFSDLPDEIQNALSLRPYLRVVTLLKQTAPTLKYEVFLRLNTGGERLNAQEIRNVAYAGSLNNLLFELSDNDVIKERMKITNKSSPNYRNMADLELVLRFITLRERWQNMSTNLLSNEMDDYIKVHKDMSGDDIEQARNDFNESLDLCINIWGDGVFFKPNGAEWRTQMIVPLFDAQMMSMYLLSPKQKDRVLEFKEQIVTDSRRLYETDELYKNAVDRATGNPQNIQRRIGKLSEMIENIIGE